MNGEMVLHEGGGGAPPSPPPNPVLLVHRLLRGRYPIAIILGLIFAIPAGVVGYHALKPQYTSTAVLRVITSRERLPYEEEDARVQSSDSLISAHAIRMTDEDFLFRVVATPTVRNLGWPQGYVGVNQLNKRLRVSPGRNSDLIHVSIDADDNVTANALASAVVEEYLNLQDETALNNPKLKQFESLKERLETQLQSNLGDRSRLEEQHGFPDAGEELSHIRARRKELEEMEFETKFFLAELGFTIEEIEKAARIQESPVPDEAAESPGSQEPVAPVSTTPPPSPAPPAIPKTRSSDELAELLAQTDPELAGLLDMRDRLRQQVDALSLKLTPKAPELARARRSLENAEFKVAERVANADPLILESLEATSPPVLSSRQQAIQRVKTLRDQQASVNAEYNKVFAAKIEFDRVDREIESLAEDIDAVERSIEEINRLNVLTIESVGVVRAVTKPTRPIEPSKDRRIPLAAIGFMGGGGMGVLMVVGYGFLRPRFRYIDEIEDAPSGASRLLGSLPDLSDGDADAAELAALSIHHIRGSLEIKQRGRERGAVVTLTSASPGDGKTSVALSLATSFAIAGHRTAIVDADMVGQNLSRELGLDGMPGLVEGLGRQSLNGEVHNTHTENLSAVPVGDIDSFAPERLNVGRLSAFFDGLRDRFDFIIVDTGPILGSIEANLISSVSDDTILVVSRGRNPKLAKAAEQRLRRLNASLCGVVFNRARKQDFSRSISTASLRTLSQATAPAKHDASMTPILKKVKSTVESE